MYKGLAENLAIGKRWFLLGLGYGFKTLSGYYNLLLKVLGAVCGGFSDHFNHVRTQKLPFLPIFGNYCPLLVSVFAVCISGIILTILGPKNSHCCIVLAIFGYFVHSICFLYFCNS